MFPNISIMATTIYSYFWTYDLHEWKYFKYRNCGQLQLIRVLDLYSIKSMYLMFRDRYSDQLQILLKLNP